MVTNNGSYQLLIEKLDRFIRKFYLNQFIRGLLFSVGFILLFFLLINILEHYFYFGTGPRKILFFSFLVSSLAALSFWVFTPLLKYFQLGKIISHEQAAEIIGNHFDDVKDKLLNILQLKKHADLQVSKDLVLASIDQKSEEIKVVPFKKAIDLNNNRKHLRYSLPPLLILLVLLLAAPSVITNSTHRLVHNNQEFEKEAPFAFDIANDDLRVVQYDDFTLDVQVSGDALPNEAFIKVDDYVYRLQKQSPDHYTYTFNNVQKDVPFTLFSGDVESAGYALNIIKKPVIIDFNVGLDYPAYTQRRDERLENNGDLVIPVGTKVNWQVNTMNTEHVHIQLNGSLQKLNRKSSSLYDFTSRVYRPGTYKLMIGNEQLPYPDSVQYSIQIIPDQYPAIDVEPFVDSAASDLVYFIGNASDDYGIKTITFNYRVKAASAKEGDLITVPVLDPVNRNTQYQYTWDKSELTLRPGDQLTYYFEVFDNDGINGSKSSKTEVFEINKPTVEEYEEKAEANNQDIKEELEKSLLESRKLKEDIKKLKEKLLQKKELSWEEKKEIEKLLDRQKELEKMIEEAKEKFKENQANQEEFTQPNEELLEKQEKIEEMFEDLMSEEMKSLMEEIQNLLQELQKDEALEMMQQFEFSDQELEMDLDRMLELFKHLEIEQEMQQQINKLEELAEQQEELSEKTKNTKAEENQEGEEEGENQEGDDQNTEEGQEEGENSQEDLQEEQEEINEKFEEIKDKLEEINEKNEDLERPKELGDFEEQQEEISEELQNSSEKLEQQQNQKASESQQNASEKMKEMAASMSNQMQSAEMEQMQEDMKALRQLLENLVSLSFDQEALIKRLARSRINTPAYISRVQDQHKLKGDFQLIQDSLLALSKRVMQIESFVTEKISAVNENMDVGLKRLEERQKSQAADNQQRIMTNVNDLALMLNEAMEQMQQQMAGMMSGSQMCNNPGNSSGKTPSDKMTKANQQMGEQMKKMMEGLKQGEGNMSSEQFAKMAARQAALRKLLREIQQEKSEKGQGSKELEDLQNELNKIEIDLVNKQLTNEMLKRQQDIQTRLLEAEKAERIRGEEEKRKAEVGTEKDRELPPSLQEYIKKREAEIENFKLISPDVKPYYKQLIDEYVKSLKSNK